MSRTGGFTRVSNNKSRVIPNIMLNYKSLLSFERRRTSSIEGRNLAEELASDRSRILYSTPFRRLAQKAQVFSLEQNAVVRNRITHSLEVSDVGRWIAYEVTKDLVEKSLIEIDMQLPIIYAVENACLLHDIGNPPFGHFGEAAIKEWFARNWEEICRRAGNKDAVSPNDKLLASDFLEFDGNPQGVRIVLRLQYDKDKYSLNLTHSTLLSLIKYPCSPSEKDSSTPLKKKPGYFESEKGLILKIKEKLSIPETARYPLAYIMEAADDIAFCISDIEDGIEKNILNTKDFFGVLTEEWNQIRSKGDHDYFPIGNIRERSDHNLKFNDFKTNYTREAIKEAKRSYLALEGKFLTDLPSSLFPDDSEIGRAIKCLKNVARRELFRSPEAEDPELAGHKIITGLLDAFKPLLICSQEDFHKLIRSKENPTIVYGQGLDLQWRLFNKLSRKYLAVYNESVSEGKLPEWFFRAHLIVDYISGMTDRFALNLYQLLNGNKYA